MMAVRGYIFDYGGTLDTGGCHWGKTLWHAYQRAGMPTDWAQFRRAYVYAERYIDAHGSIQRDDTFRTTLQTKIDLQTRYLCQHEGWTADETQRRNACRVLLDDLYEGVRRQTAHSREVLDSLRRDYPLALVSNFYGNMPTVLREFRLDHLFTTVIEAAAVGIRKPDPRLFALAIEALGLKPCEVAVVGDSIKKDILPAKSLGCHTIWLQGEGWDDTPLDTTVPDRIITDLVSLKR